MPDPAPEVTCWTDASRVGLVRAVFERLSGEVHLLSLGGARSPELDALAADLDAPRGDDLRQMLVDKPSAFLLVATREAASLEDLKSAARQGTRVLTLEPLASELPAWGELGRASVDGRKLTESLSYVPEFSAIRHFNDLADEENGAAEPGMTRLNFVGPPGGLSLFAQLFTAWRTALSVNPVPESIDASIVGPDALPNSLRGLKGHVACHARCASGSSILIHASDQGSVSDRRVHVVTREATFFADDRGHHWTSPGPGSPDAEATPGMTPAPTEASPPPADLIAEAWRRLIDRPTSHEPADAKRTESALACCLTCLLSARTRQAESPSTVLAMQL